MKQRTPKQTFVRLLLVLLCLVIIALLIALWSIPNSGCHLLGGHIEVLLGPGKDKVCVIPW